LKLFCFFIGLVFLTPCTAQWSYGGQFSFVHFSGPTGLKHFGGGISGDYEINERTGVYGGVDFFLPQSYEANTTLTANYGNTVPFILVVPVDSRVSFTRIGIAAKRYFVGRYEGDEHQRLGFYGTGGFGILIGARTSNIPSYDKTVYSSPITDEKTQTFINWIAGLGVGTEYLLGKTYLCLSIISRYTFDQANQALIKTTIPFMFDYNFGMRIPLVPKAG
jgi:hypothetical protein